MIEGFGQASEATRKRNPEFFGITAKAVVPSKAVVKERDLHEEIEEYCKGQGWLICHSRMDRPSTIAVGFPDFAIFMPGARTCFLECKAPGKKATTEQLAKLAHAKKLGFIAEIVESMEAAREAIAKAVEDEPRRRGGAEVTGVTATMNL